jgi:hypothetical protein
MRNKVTKRGVVETVQPFEGMANDFRFGSRGGNRRGSLASPSVLYAKRACAASERTLQDVIISHAYRLNPKHFQNGQSCRGGRFAPVVARSCRTRGGTKEVDQRVDAALVSFQGQTLSGGQLLGNVG